MYILPLLILLAFSAFFSSVEIAFTSLNRMRLDKLAEDGSASARLAGKIEDKYHVALSTLLVGNTLVNTAASSLCTVLATARLGEAKGGIVSTAVFTVVVLIFGEILPKILGKRMALRYACVTSYPLLVLMVVFRPVTLVVGGVVAVVSLLWKKKKAEEPAAATEDEIANIIETVEEEGVIDEDQGELLQSALDFSDITVEEVMTPRVDVIGVDLDDPVSESFSKILDTIYSRFPVYHDSVDHISGILYLSSYMKEVAALGLDNVRMEDHIRPTVFVHKTTKLPDALEKMRQNQLHMIVVLDEYGGTLGIVTMEDILEEIVGDIWDENEVIEQEIVQTGTNTYEVQGSTNVEDFFDELDVDCHDFESEYTTVGGWAVEMLNEDVHVGDSFTYKNLYIEISEMANSIVESLLVLVKDEDEGGEEESNE